MVHFVSGELATGVVGVGGVSCGLAHLAPTRIGGNRRGGCFCTHQGYSYVAGQNIGLQAPMTFKRPQETARRGIEEFAASAAATHRHLSVRLDHGRLRVAQTNVF